MRSMLAIEPCLWCLKPLLTSDCTIVVVSGEIEFTRCEEPSPFLVATELLELVFQLEIST